MLCNTNGPRETESIKHMHRLIEVSGWLYEQSMNERYTDLPADTCARPDVVQLELW